MIEESRFYAKGLQRAVFTGDMPERRPITHDMREAAERFAEPGYRALTSDG